jgi:Holliday junction resolvase RusA-like endonuclease
MIFINGHVASSKNSKQWTGKFLVNSKQTATYVKSSKADFLKLKPDFLKMIEGEEKPLRIGFHFVRKSKHKYDFHNVVQTITDLMTKYEYIPDDNTTEIMPFPLLIDDTYSTYDKDNPGVFISVIK